MIDTAKGPGLRKWGWRRTKMSPEELWAGWPDPMIQRMQTESMFPVPGEGWADVRRECGLGFRGLR